jgi:hypothetical protein
MSSPSDYYKQKIYKAANTAGRAASNAKQFVYGAANAFNNPNNANNYSSNAAVKVNRFASSGSSTGSGSGVVSDGQYKMYTREKLEQLYGNKQNRGNSMSISLGEGPIEHIIMMFQLYIALIGALSRLIENAASRGMSLLFGNETLINMFSIFLENALNLIVNRKVSGMSLDDLQKSLEQNKPKLQQMSALLISATSTLALGLSSVCSKIATDFVTNLLPGLLQSSAIAASSAAEAGINAATMGAFGEVIEIFSAAAAVVGAAMKIITALASNVENVGEAFTTVKKAYDEIIDLIDLFSESPTEIAAGLRDAAASATAAVIPQAAQDIANKAIDTLTNTGNPYFNASAPSTTFDNLVNSGVNKGASYLQNVGTGLKDIKNKIINNVSQPPNPATVTKGGNRRRKNNKSIRNKKHYKKYMYHLRRKTAKKELDLLKGIRNFKSMISL